MRKLICALALAGVGVVGAVPAQAVLVDLTGVNPATSTTTYMSLQIGKISITNTLGSVGAIGAWAKNNASTADPINGSIFNNSTYSISTIKSTDGSVLDFTSIGLATLFNNIGYTDTSTITIGLENISHVIESFTFTTDGLPGLQDFAIGRSGYSLTVKANPGSFRGVQFGRIDIANLDGAVPESATWAMFIGGFGMIGGAMRRRQRIAVRYT